MRLFVFVFFERNGAVEDQVFGSGIGVNVVIAGARELQIVERLERLDIFFDKVSYFLWISPRAISISPLHVSPHFHF